MGSIVIGEVIGQRFEIESLANSGGMGSVFRARDRSTGEPVAIKVLTQERPNAYVEERFAREALLLSQLRHPRIVSYIAHGLTEQKQRFIAMEWLEGEDLAERLKRGALSLDDCLTLLTQCAEALALAHRREIIHRDIKPSNLFLRNGSVSDVVIVDFGIARGVMARPALTQTGELIGTPAYMAPEQARGHSGLSPCADVFSLGCVVYECLTGEPLFASEHVAGILAKILFEDPPSLRQRCPVVPAALAELLTQMLAKDPAERPQDAVELSYTLAAIANDTHCGGRLGTPLSPVALSVAEQQLYTVVVAAPRRASVEHAGTMSNAEIDLRKAQQRSLNRALARFDAQPEWLADGSMVTAFLGESSATDQVSRAARCALVAQQHWPEAIVAISTGRGIRGDRGLVGEVLDRVMGILAGRRSQSAAPTPPLPEKFQPATSRVWLDGLSADLLDGQFLLTRESASAFLTGTELDLDSMRPLLGQPTPCVGRERELALVKTVLDSCVADSRPDALVFVAPPGLGKSRLRHEFIRRLRSRAVDIEILVGSGDPLSSGSAYALIGQLLRRHCEVYSGEDPQVQQDKLLRRAGRYLDPADAGRTASFLGELCGVPFPDAHDVQLRTARRNPKLMCDQIAQAWLHWLRAECTQRPVLIVLEDLHWSDLLTIDLIGQALRELADQPFLILALARPEIDERVPGLWSNYIQRLRLDGLSKRASAELIKSVLGPQIEAQSVERIAQQAAGNALYLEELIRAAAKENAPIVSDSVLAMLQIRLSALAPEMRRTLRAASIFGSTFWRGGIAMLLGQPHASGQLDRWLQALIEEEVITPHRDSRFLDESEYSFRHPLVQDAVYGLLTGSDRTLGHRLAGAFLEQAGEPDAMILAEHFYQGGEPAQALPWYERSAEREVMSNDFERAWLCTERGVQCGVQCGAPGQQLAVLRSVQCAVHFYRYHWAESYPAGMEALHWLTAGSIRWFRTLGYMLVSAGVYGKPEAFEQLVELFGRTTPEQDARSIFIEAATLLISTFTMLGARSRAGALMGHILQMREQLPFHDADGLGWLHLAHTVYTRTLEADPFTAALAAERSRVAFLEAGSTRNALMAQVFLAMANFELGEWRASANMLREVASVGRRLREPLVVKGAEAFLAFMLPVRGDAAAIEEAQTLAEEAINAPGTADGSRATALCGLARIAIAGGDLTQAEAYARKAQQTTPTMPVEQIQAITILLQIASRQMRDAELRSLAAAGLAILESISCAGHAEVPFRLAVAEAYAALGDTGAAHGALRETLRQIQLRANRISDPSWRASYLSEAPENIRARQLASSWLGAVAPTM